MTDAAAARSILIVGASRGLGFGLARAFAGEGWRVTATVRDLARAPAALKGAGVEVMACDINVLESTAALHEATAGRAFDAIFIVAGIIKTWSGLTDGGVPAALEVMHTNAVSPGLLAEAFVDRLEPGGQMIFMTSALGSLAENLAGGLDAYRASKAALNMIAKCFSQRHPDLTVTLMHPGWVKTDMGGANAAVEIADSVGGMVKVATGRLGQGGLAFLAYDGRPVAW